MKTQDTNTTGAAMASSPPTRSKGNRWFAGIGALIVVALVVGLSVAVFAQLGQRHGGHGAGVQAPPSGQWVDVLNGYTLTSLAAARSDSAVLYACATRSGLDRASNEMNFTVLRSSDFGSHWQDLSSKVVLSAKCQLAINPGDSNDVYAVGAPSNAQSPDALQHTTDGGQTWTTIQPTLHVPGIQSPVAWHIQQISIEGGRLFGLQWVFQGGPQPNASLQPQVSFQFPRLVTSVDGGHTWTALNNQFGTTKQGVRNYVVDSSHPSTIYALVGGFLLPVQPPIVRQGGGPMLADGYGGVDELYKTTDGGATWHLLLKGLPFASQVYLAIGKPDLVYVGGSIGPLPLNRTEPNNPIAAVGAFLLQVSSDSGTTWHTVPPAPGVTSVQGWFVSSDGQVYAYTANGGAPGGQPTAVSGTAVPSVSTPGTSYITTAPSSSIQRYDPATNKWSAVTNPPTSGTFLAVTPVDANGGAVLWFMGTSNGKAALYRYVV